MYLKLALLNTFRNKRRAFLNIVMIAGGVSGMILFEGFTHNVLDMMEEIATKSTYGHIQVAKNSFWDKTAKNPKDNLLQDSEKLTQSFRGLNGVLTAAGRLSFFGLIGNEEKTIGARALCLDPVAEKDVVGAYRIIAGETLGPPTSGEPRILVGSGLAQNLGVKPGNSLTVVSFTYDKVINAIDVTVQGVFETAIAEVDDAVFLLPLDAAQRLLDTDQVEKIVVRLDRTEMTPSFTPVIQEGASKIDPSLKARPWYLIDRLYNQVKQFFNGQNHIIEAIIVSLILLGILNTLGMSVFERTGEIGTLRSLGTTRKKVIQQFIAEGMILAGIGISVGTVIGVILAKVISRLGIEVVMPNASRPILLLIDLYPGSFVAAWALTLSAALLASAIPAYRITRMRVVDALRANI